MFGFRIAHELGAWGSGFHNSTDALEAAVEDAKSIEGVVLVYLTYSGEVIASYWLA